MGLAATLSGQAAEPSQAPLVHRSAPPPPPNVMVTLDDSGSMTFDFLPEETFVQNGASILLGNDAAALCRRPQGTAKCINGGWPNDPRRLANGAWNYQTGTVTATRLNPPVYQMQFRSPDVNPLYYNPDVLYRPWVDPVATSDWQNPRRFPNATPAAAKWDPILPSSPSTFDLTITQTIGGTDWCTTPDDAGCSHPATGLAFAPGLVYRLKTASSDPTRSTSYDAYDVNDPAAYPTRWRHAAARVDCPAGLGCTQAQEQQNFANWFTYYRMRESMVKGGLGEIVADRVNALRLGFGEFNQGAVRPGKVVQDGMSPLTADSVKTLLSHVYAIRSFGGTPTRKSLLEVGRYFSSDAADGFGSGATSPWNASPGQVDPTPLTCRRSVNLLLTDGYYNDTDDQVTTVLHGVGFDFSTMSASLDRLDGAPNGWVGSTDNPNAYSPDHYVAKRPFVDAVPAPASLANVATLLFANDLQRGMDNKVPPIDGDLAYWQHLTQVMIGLGVHGTLDASSAASRAAVLQAITSGSQSWPAPTASEAAKIDDMWHAAVNSGGDFYSIRNVGELSAALTDAFGKASGVTAREAGVATTSTVLRSGSLKLVPSYQSVTWRGDLTAYALDGNGAVSSGGTPVWVASAEMPAWDRRNLFTWDGTRARPFTWDAMGSANQGTLSASVSGLATGQTLTDFIRGDAGNEGLGLAHRSRGGQILGDFVDAAPVLVKDLLDLNYDAIRADYRQYVSLKKARTAGVVFLGGNAGILEAFDASTGAEVYGYLPQAGLANLNLVGQKNYGTTRNYHRFFVDGPLVETDAYIATPGNAAAWANVVVGSMGAGGKAFFALHVPTANPTALDANALMWERHSANDPDIGNILGPIAVGKVKGGDWEAFVGNGIYSASGTAMLMVVNLATGQIDAKLTVPGGVNNGLMGVSLLRDEATREVVAAFAGDLNGNLWRFDFEGGTPASWKLGFSGRPLFTAAVSGVGQPITGAPAFVSHPTGLGRVVLFGTGKLVDEVDGDDRHPQTFYGVWDKTAAGASSAKAVSPFQGGSDERAALQAQVASATPVYDPTDIRQAFAYFKVTTMPVDWSRQLGWYMDLPFARQRVLQPALVVARNYVFIQTLLPAGSAPVCDVSKGVGYNYLLAAADGAAIADPVYDTNADGRVDGKDVAVAGYQTEADGVDQILIDPTDPSHLVDEDTHGSRQIKLPRQGLIFKDRIWRQIVNPPIP